MKRLIIQITSFSVLFSPLFSEELPLFEVGESPLISLEQELSLLDQEFTGEFFISQPVENQEVKEEIDLTIIHNEEEQPLLLEEESLPFIPFTPEKPLQRSQEGLFAQEDPPAIFQVEGEEKPVGIQVNFSQAFRASPFIYSLLFALSVGALGIWLYTAFLLNRISQVPLTFVSHLQDRLNSNHFEEAFFLCSQHSHIYGKMVGAGILSRKHGLSAIAEAMKGEGKRVSIQLWQKIGLLNDIAIIAPLFGLLGTVLGMFYAFYDVNRSIESVSTLFDGLGVSVGTTVAGLFVAILSLILHSTAKYRLVRALANAESQTQRFAHLIDDRTSISQGNSQ